MTAVEWLLEEFQEVHRDYGGLDTNWLKRFEQAKKMEKQQRIDFADSYGTYLLVGGTMSAATYNEIFNKE
jgi:hypothetical protein